MTMPPTSTRREFLSSATALTLTALAPANSAAAAPSLPIVDTHVHLWDLARFRLPWLEGASGLNRNFLWQDYRQAAEGLDVVKAVYMEVDVDPSQQEREADTVAELCRRGDTVLAAAVISGRPASDRFAAYIKRFAAQPVIKGVRQVLHGPGTPPGTCLDPAFIRGIRLLGELGLSFDLCMRPGELPDGAKLAEACPGTSFILDHCGNPEVFARDLTPWKKHLALVAGRPNVCCKVSGIVASTGGRPWKPEDLAPIINHVLAAFGPDRVVFGGDWPVCLLGASLARWVQALREVVRERGVGERRKLFHDNAVRVYRLH
jgi:L-fuconolactonase